MPACLLQAISTHDDSHHYRPESDVSARLLANIHIGDSSTHGRLHPQLAFSMACTLRSRTKCTQTASRRPRPPAQVAPRMCRNTDCARTLAMPSCTRKHLLSSYLACWGSSSADCAPPQPLFRWRTPPLRLLRVTRGRSQCRQLSHSISIPASCWRQPASSGSDAVNGRHM